MTCTLKRALSLILAAALFAVSAFVLAARPSAAGRTLSSRLKYNDSKVTLLVDKYDSADTLRYTTNGKEPTAASKKYKDSGITASKKTTVKLAEFDKNGKVVATLNIVIMPRAPMADVETVTKSGKTYLKLSSKISGAKIYYTTDGTDPTKKSAVYKKKFLYTPGTLVKIRVYAKNYADGYIRSYIVEDTSAELGKVSDEVRAVFELVNRERSAEGLTAYKIDAELCKAADIRAKELAALFDKNHLRPDGRKGTTVIDDLGIKWTKRSENIAKDQPTPERAVEAWMESASHKAAILSTDYDYIGIGHYEANGTHYWVQLFLRK